MMGIYWEENGNETRILNEYDSKWYNYSKLDFRMANAKTEDGNYWVWIPRYSYKQTLEGTDIEFVSGKTNIATNNKSMLGYTIKEAFSENGEITGFRMRCEKSKLTTVNALHTAGLETIAAGDSYNDLGMIKASKAGFLFKSTEQIKKDYPQLEAFEEFDDLLAAIGKVYIGIDVDSAGTVLRVVGEGDLGGGAGRYGGGVERCRGTATGGAHALDAHALVTHIAQGEGVAHRLVILREGAQVMGVVLATQQLGSLWVHLRTHDRVYLFTRKATHIAHRHLGNGAKRKQEGEGGEGESTHGN